MEAKIFVIAFPTMGTITEKIHSVLEDAFCKKCDETPKKCTREIEDLTPPRFRVKDACGCPQCAPAWGIGGTPANENLRFGYKGPEIDEPRRENYDDRWEFEDDHAAYDRYVDAAEDCIERGLERTSSAPIHRCNAIRKPVGCPPPMWYEIPDNKQLIGETDWWSEDDFDWEW